MYKNVVFVFLCLKYAIIFCIGCVACYLIFSLITFYPFDDSYFQFTGNDVFHNICGEIGAVCSDILFFMFGLPAYVFPCIILFLIGEYLFKKKIDFWNVIYRTIGGIVLLFSLCGLIEFFINDFYYCYSGGIVGVLLREQILYMLNDTVMNIIFLLFIVLGMILLMQRSLLLVFKKRNIFVFKFIIYLKCYIKKQYLEIFFLNILRTINQFIILIYVYLIFFVKEHVLLVQYFQQKFNYIVIRIIFCIEKNIFYSSIIRFCRFLFKNRFVSNKNSVIFSFKNSKYMDIASKYCASYNFTPVSLNNVETNIYCSKDNIQSVNYKNKNFLGYGSFKNTKSIKEKNQFNIIDKAHLLSDKSLSIQQKKRVLLLNKKSFNLLPSIDLLFISLCSKKCTDINFLKQQSALLESKLLDYHVEARVVNILQGPVITRFELDLAPGVKSARISSLSRDLARALSVSNLQIIEVIPGKPYIGLEIPNSHREMVYLREVLDTEKFRSSCNFLTFALGKDIIGEPVIANLNEMPHLLIAGTTGSGKSIGINSIIISILYKSTPEDVRFIMIDPKILELSVYEDIPHLLTNVVTDINDVVDVLNWCVDEMERRYKIMAHYGVRNLINYNNRIKSYNAMNKFSVHTSFSIDSARNTTSIKSLEKLPYIIIVIDEFSDLVLSGGKQVEKLIIRLSQKSRACGIHLILATQRPSVNVITGLIKANIPSRIAFAVSSKIDSRTILDQSGAESLLGMGDMLYLASSSSVPVRVQGAFVSDEEVLAVVKYLKNLVYE